MQNIKLDLRDFEEFTVLVAIPPHPLGWYYFMRLQQLPQPPVEVVIE